MRERGLKPVLPAASLVFYQVAPHAGAWIETCNFFLAFMYVQVAPHAGAWIETWWSKLICFHLESFPMRERGLKLFEN